MAEITSLQIGQNKLEFSSSSKYTAETIFSKVQITDDKVIPYNGSVLTYDNSKYKKIIDHMASLYVDGTNIPEFFLVDGGGVPFEQPVLSSNGTLGGNSFAVTQSPSYSSNEGGGPAYQVFDGKSGTCWYPNGSFPRELTMYNPFPLCVSNIQVTNHNDTIRVATAGKIYGSNDNSNWVELTSWTNNNISNHSSWDITVNSDAYYFYHKFSITADSQSGNGAEIEKIQLTATESKSAIDQYNSSLSTSGFCNKYIYDPINKTLKIPTHSVTDGYEYLYIG